MFKKDDVLFARGLKKVFEEGTYPLKPKEVASFGAVMHFVAAIESKIEASLKQNEQLKNDIAKALSEIEDLKKPKRRSRKK